MSRVFLSTLVISATIMAGTLPITGAWSRDVGGSDSPPTVRADADSRAEALVSQLTLDEKIGQLLNVAPAIPRLQIPAYNWWTESLHGAIGMVPTTNFPEPIGLAATFDSPLIGSVAKAISIEVRGLHTLGRETGHLGHIGTGLDSWSPNINIFRDPRWGRGQETYGEDPYLTARMGVAFVEGLQGDNPDLPDIIASPKHFAVHSGPEPTRHVADVFVSAHDLEDTYLPAFRAAIVEGKAQSIMCAYNRIDGQPACGNDLLLQDHLRGAWGFQGYVVSDCDAVTDISNRHHYAPDPAAAVAVALKAGVDNECNTETLSDKPGLSARYQEAYQRGLISMADIDRALVRLFAARFRNGDLAGLPQRTAAPVPVTAINSADHRALSLQAAVESLVLLKNDGVLPLRAGAKIAVIGPLGDATRVLRGNYSSPLTDPGPVSLLDGLRQSMPSATVTLVPFGPSITDGDPIPGSAFVTPDGQPGLRAEYINIAASAAGEDDKPVLTRIEPGLVSRAGVLPQVADHHRVVWTGALVVPESGVYRLGIQGVTGAIEIPGQPNVSAKTTSFWGDPLKLVTVTLEKGRRYPIHFQADSRVMAGAGLFWKRVSLHPEADLAAAVARADVVVAAVGLTSDLEGEEMKVQIDGFAGGDRTSLDLPADQRHLLEQAKALGKPLVVVLMNGSAVDLAWATANASAIVEAWYPGQRGGLAIGSVLAGQADPGGRLPVTFYHSVADLPAFDDYRMAGRTYRYFAGTPVFPFGFGLSYTQFSYQPVTVQPAADGVEAGLLVSTELANVGGRDGEEVVELYLTPPQFDGAPKLALRGFQRVALKAGEHRVVTFALSPRDLSFVTRDGVRQLTPGHYRIDVGSGQPGSGVVTQAADFEITKLTPIAE